MNSHNSVEVQRDDDNVHTDNTAREEATEALEEDGESQLSDEEYDDDDDMTEEEEYEEEEEHENLLSFSIFPLDTLRGQHIMVAAAFNRLLVIGTNRGVVALVEASGVVARTLHCHVDPISDVSCDGVEEHVGSSDKAGVLTVQNLHDDNDAYRREFDVPIHSMALHPNYSRNEERPVVLGCGGKVILITKTKILGHRKTSVLQERRGKVHAVRWCGPDLIAWANDSGVQLYSYTGRSVLQFVARPKDSVRLEFYPCSLVWESPGTLTCGWGDWIQVFHVHELRMDERLRWGTEFMSRTHRVDVMPPIRTCTALDPCRVCGIAPFGSDRYLVLVCSVEQEGYIKELEVRIVERTTFANIYRGRLQSKYKHPLQYSLTFFIGGGGGNNGNSSRRNHVSTTPQASSTELSSFSSNDLLLDAVFFITSVDAIIKAMPIDDDQHVEYLLKVGRFREAYMYAHTHILHEYQLADIGHCFLHHLFAEKKYEEASSLLSEVLQDDYVEWERWICQFDQSGMTDLLIDVIPCHNKSNGDAHSENNRRETTQENEEKEERGEKDSSRIGEEYYELVLLRYLEKDVFLFQKAVCKFKGMFRYDVVCHAAELRYNDWKLQSNAGTASEEQKKALGETYGMLLRLSGQYEKALQVLLRVDQSDELFTLIHEKRLFVKALEMLPELFARNEDRTIKLLLDHVHPEKTAAAEEEETADMLSSAPPSSSSSMSSWASLAPESVVKRLERTQRRYLWVYLKALQTYDKATHTAISEAHAQLVATLFIENEPSGLYKFLRENSARLPALKEIYALCKKHRLLEEMVFLLAKMGKEEEGLRTIVYDMKNMKTAVQFIADAPNADDQLSLYKKLLHMTLELNATLPSRHGQKYFEHRVNKGETWASVAQMYDISEGDLRAANNIGNSLPDKADNNNNDACNSCLAPTRSSCVVPVNFMKALLRAIVDPSINGRVTLDPTYVIKLLPEDEPMPNVGKCIANVARSKANDVGLMATVVHVATCDLGKQHEKLYKRRLAAIRVEPGVAICFICQQPTSTSVVAFGCFHTYHMNCVLDYLAGEGVLAVQPADIDASHFFKHPEEYTRQKASQTSSPRCILCHEMRRTSK